MMALSDLLAPGGAVADLPGGSRKQVLQALSELAHRTLNVPARPILEAVMERERLGSTGLGDGVAIPHARTPLVEKTCGVFARLKTPVDFDAVDGRPADLVFMLLAPEDSSADHLKALARISRLFRREDFRKAVRAAPNSAAVYAILAGAVHTDAA
jgi:PTS system nitrogen regulatory IIA component